MRLDFSVQARAAGSQARAARFRTLHNEVLTPIFMPVGTQATVKAQLTQSLEDAGSQIVLANTYHLLLRPGPEIFRKMGGIHRFMSWNRSVLTDSGGFQIFSLERGREMTEEGARFKSHIDGRPIFLSPETSIDMQKAIGSDIMMALDQCVPSTVDRGAAETAMELTHRWARRSLDARGDSPQALFGIVQGALFPDLRRRSVEALSGMPFDGFAIGGLAVGEGKSEREDTCELTTRLMPEDRPRYMMGVGTPLDILEAVHRGVDMFDCVLPTKLGGRGGAYTSRGHVQLRRGVYRTADEPLDPDCACPTCRRYSRAYLSHLARTGEVLGWSLIGGHNIWFYHRLMRDIRESILEGRFLELYRERREYLQADDLDHPIHGPKRNPKKVRREAPLSLGDYEVRISSSMPTSGEGSQARTFANIRQRSSGEVMHAKVAPLEEAERLYVAQSRLAGRLALAPGEAPESASPLVIWDVGLGAAANAMAAIRAYEAVASGGPVRPLRIVSFENDLDSLRLALLHSDKFDYLRHGGPVAIAERGRWESKRHPGLSWELIEGDFLEALAARRPAVPDLVFYDMFSFKSQSREWGTQAFGRVFEACRGHATELFTYSSSTGVRVALLSAGFYVAKGAATCDKAETTIALTPRARERLEPGRLELLAADWLGRWSRSGAKFPPELADGDRPSFERMIRDHGQFRALGTEAPTTVPASAP